MRFYAGIAFPIPLGELGDVYLGASMYHINKPTVSFDPSNNNKLDRRIGINGGLTVPSGARDAFIPVVKLDYRNFCLVLNLVRYSSNCV